MKLPDCDHVYCADCICTMFNMVTRDESSFPPKCCSNPINITTIHHFLHRPQITAYNKRAAEFRICEKNRRYCADTSCNSFLGRANNGILRCGRCGQLTCDTCKSYAHLGPCKDQGRDVERLDADFKDLALAEGWQACSACSRTVALTEGCNHITLVSLCPSISHPWY